MERSSNRYVTIDAKVVKQEQIKSKVLGLYINGSLTEGVRQTLNAEIEFFQIKDYSGRKHYDNPSYYYKVASYVDPNNEQLIGMVKKELSSFDVKSFNHSIAKMSAEFTILSRRVTEYGGTYTNDEKFRDMWKTIATMKKKYSLNMFSASTMIFAIVY